MTHVAFFFIGVTVSLAIGCYNLDNKLTRKNVEITNLRHTLIDHRKRCSKTADYEKCSHCSDNACAYDRYMAKEDPETLEKIIERQSRFLTGSEVNK